MTGENHFRFDQGILIFIRKLDSLLGTLKESIAAVSGFSLK